MTFYINDIIRLFSAICVVYFTFTSGHRNQPEAHNGSVQNTHVPFKTKCDFGLETKQLRIRHLKKSLKQTIKQYIDTPVCVFVSLHV